jgi:hypothetical protein
VKLGNSLFVSWCVTAKTVYFFARCVTIFTIVDICKAWHYSIFSYIWSLLLIWNCCASKSVMTLRTNLVEDNNCSVTCVEEFPKLENYNESNLGDVHSGIVKCARMRGFSSTFDRNCPVGYDTMNFLSRIVGNCQYGKHEVHWWSIVLYSLLVYF